MHLITNTRIVLVAALTLLADQDRLLADEAKRSTPTVADAIGIKAPMDAQGKKINSGNN